MEMPSSVKSMLHHIYHVSCYTGSYMTWHVSTPILGLKFLRVDPNFDRGDFDILSPCI